MDLKVRKGFFLFIVITFALVGCTEKNFPRTGNVKPPREIISWERAHEMYRSYQERYNVLTEHRNGQEDSKYGWHSLDFYKNYIAYIEQEAAKVKIKVSGIRLYYVAYPEKDEMSGDQSGYQTYIYVPTYYDSKLRKHIAFDPFHVDEKGKPFPLHQAIVSGKKSGGKNNSRQRSLKSQNAASNATSRSIIANMSQMCPLNCPESN